MTYLWVYLWGFAICTVPMLLLTVFELAFHSIVGRFTHTFGRFISSNGKEYDGSWIVATLLWPLTLVAITVYGIIVSVTVIIKLIFRGVRSVVYRFLPKEIKQEVLERAVEISLGVTEDNQAK